MLVGCDGEVREDLTRIVSAGSEGKRFARSANAHLRRKGRAEDGAPGFQPGLDLCHLPRNFQTASDLDCRVEVLYRTQLQTQLPVLVGWVEQEPRVTGGPADLMQAT
jgi:hypothetical protein